MGPPTDETDAVTLKYVSDSVALLQNDNKRELNALRSSVDASLKSVITAVYLPAGNTQHLPEMVGDLQLHLTELQGAVADILKRLNMNNPWIKTAGSYV